MGNNLVPGRGVCAKRRTVAFRGWDRHAERQQAEAAPDGFVQKDYVEEQAFIAGLSSCLSGIHADRVEPSMKHGQCELEPTFRI